MEQVERFLRQAIGLATRNVTDHAGRPFGAVLVRGDEVIATGVNEVVATADPTAHAELQAIRAASRALGNPRLDGCIIYASGHPCPMCLSAMYLTGIERVYYAYSNEAADAYGLSTTKIYAELAKSISDQALKVVGVTLQSEGEHLYELWRKSQGSGAGR